MAQSQRRHAVEGVIYRSSRIAQMGNAPRINVGGGYRNWLARKIAPRENSPYLSKVAESGGGSLDVCL